MVEAQEQLLGEKAEATASKKAPLPETTYIVLVSSGKDDWKEAQRISSRSADGAIRAVAESFGEGTYVAVPARSWKPSKVAVVTQTKLTLS